MNLYNCSHDLLQFQRIKEIILSDKDNPKIKIKIYVTFSSYPPMTIILYLSRVKQKF